MKPYLSRSTDLSLNIRLILQTPQGSTGHSKGSTAGWATKVLVIGLFSIKIGFLTIGLGLPVIAKANILSIVGSIFSPATATAEVDINGSSQKMALLEAPISATARGNVATPVVTVVNNALVPKGVVPFATSTTAKTSSSVQATDGNEIRNYKVKTGDTISSIADDNNISINTILWANNLKRTSVLKLGQNLVLLPTTGVSYKIVSGDTLKAIALKFHGDAKEIAAYNDLDDSRLKIGDTIIIPDGEYSAPAVSTTKLASSAVTKVASAALGVSVARADVETTTVGYYVRPIKGGTRTQGVHATNGVDLADACGTPIYAAASGSVIISKDDGQWDGGFGNYVVIQHGNGSQTLYAHLKTATVDEGQTVSQGQQIGTIGATGKVSGATGCHVHFEIRNGPRNPF